MGYILSFVLVRIRTIRLSARLGAHIEFRCSRSRGQDITVTNVIIKTLDRNETGDVNGVMPGSNGLRILGDFWKKAVSWDLRQDEAGWFLSWARPFHLGVRDVPSIVGSDGTVSIVKIISLSLSLFLYLLVSKNLKIKKVIKVSYLNQESRQCFECFSDSYAYERCTYPYVSSIRIFV